MRKRNPIIEVAAKRLGGLVAMSRALGLSQSAAYHWTEIPVHHLDRLERLTRIPREVLRPDIFRRRRKAA